MATKPIQESIFKSRLTITYRTNITGTTQQEALPFRLLVLGNFTGNMIHDSGLLPDLEKREVKTIKRGASVDHFLAETTPSIRIPDSLSHLRAKMPGKYGAKIQVLVSPKQLAADGEVTLRIRESKGEFVSKTAQNGICDVKGPIVVRGNVTGTVKDKNLTITKIDCTVSGLVRGDLLDARTEEKLYPVTGLITGQKLTLETAALQVGELVSADPESSTKGYLLDIAFVDQPAKAERTIPFDSIRAFSPDRVAHNIPEVERLLVIKHLLHELSGSLRNLPELRGAVKSSLPAASVDPRNAELVSKQKAAVAAIAELKTWADEQYPLLKVERAKPPTNT